MNFTLRDLWHLFDEEEKRRWQQQQIQRMFPKADYMDGSMGLRGKLQQKHQMINDLMYKQEIPLEEMYRKPPSNIKIL